MGVLVNKPIVNVLAMICAAVVLILNLVIMERLIKPARDIAMITSLVL